MWDGGGCSSSEKAPTQGPTSLVRSEREGGLHADSQKRSAAKLLFVQASPRERLKLVASDIVRNLRTAIGDVL